MSAVVVDPPYDDNVQYSELADFFYVWLKRTQGHRRTDLFKPKRGAKKNALKVHPNDPHFRTALDACHALALRYAEAGGGAAGVGAARALVRQQGWKAGDPVARLMAALVEAAPEAVRHDKGAKSAGALFPEFRGWHALLPALFQLPTPDWTEKAPAQIGLFAAPTAGAGEEAELELDESEDDAEAEEG